MYMKHCISLLIFIANQDKRIRPYADMNDSFHT